MTGTPLQNNLHELVSLLLFIMPYIFTDYKSDLDQIFYQFNKLPSKKDSNGEKIIPKFL